MKATIDVKDRKEAEVIRAGPPRTQSAVRSSSSLGR